VLTAEGRELHERVEEGESEARGQIRIARDLQIRSLAEGLIGRTDVVEFHPDPAGAAMQGWPGKWRPFPVEYKRGKPKEHRADEVQLCAQAICLEEMLGCTIPRGALFYGRTRRRSEVEFDAELRGLVSVAVRRCRDLLARAQTPRARREPKCEHCSLLEICRPETLDRSAAGFLSRSIDTSLAPVPEGSDA
jgi:CRISPR-associated exonuclease Cas4